MVADSPIFLSLCMPTYNFGKFIGATLESLLPQLKPNMEIVIVDGASTDNTEEVVAHYQSPQIRYHRLAAKGGIDQDMKRSIELARGEYCWLFSSDDVMNPRAIEEALTRFEKEVDVYLLGFDIHDFDLTHFILKHPILDFEKDTVLDLSDNSQRLTYFKNAHTTTAFFSFMSSVIFKKSRWDATPHDSQFMGSCWYHATHILKMISGGLVVKYLPKSYFVKRNDNDSFMDRGPAHRCSIGVDGYHSIANRFFGEKSKEAFHIRRTLTNELRLTTIISFSLKIKGKEPRAQFIGVVKKLHADNAYLRLFLLSYLYLIYSPLEFLMFPVLNVLKKVVRCCRQSIRKFKSTRRDGKCPSI